MQPDNNRSNNARSDGSYNDGGYQYQQMPQDSSYSRPTSSFSSSSSSSSPSSFKYATGATSSKAGYDASSPGGYATTVTSNNAGDDNKNTRSIPRRNIPCLFFLQPAGCRNGNNCPYSHDVNFINSSGSTTIGKPGSKGAHKVDKRKRH